MSTTGPFTAAPVSPPSSLGGVEGNSRLTGAAGAVLFMLLAAEGVTILQIRQLISVHVFFGMLLVPIVLLKTASTSYRFAHYYAGDPPYLHKGPPHPILRLTGPLVVASTLALLGTGIALLALGRAGGQDVRTLHKASFFVWVALMAVHVIGHLRETPDLALSDVRERKTAQRLPGARIRAALLAVAIVIGLLLGLASLGWVGSWGERGSDGRGSDGRESGSPMIRVSPQEAGTGTAPSSAA